MKDGVEKIRRRMVAIKGAGIGKGYDYRSGFMPRKIRYPSTGPSRLETDPTAFNQVDAPRAYKLGRGRWTRLDVRKYFELPALPSRATTGTSALLCARHARERARPSCTYSSSTTRMLHPWIRGPLSW